MKSCSVSSAVDSGSAPYSASGYAGAKAMSVFCEKFTAACCAEAMNTIIASVSRSVSRLRICPSSPKSAMAPWLGFESSRAHCCSS